MLKQKEIQLKDKLKNIIKEIGHMNDVKQGIGKEFLSRNLYAHRAINIFTGKEPLDNLTDSEDDIRFLFLFVLVLNIVLKEKGVDISIDIHEFFTAVEIRDWTNYKEELEPESIFPLVFEDMQEIYPGYWQGKLTAQQLNKLSAANILIWNPNSQRGYKVTKKGVRINVFPKKVNQIKERILSGKQFPDDLKFNILKGIGNEPVYDPKKRTLTIYEECEVDTWDGQNRKEANSKAVSENPNLNFVWPIKITYMSEIETHEAMVQIDKQTPINKEVIVFKDTSKDENLTVDKIMDMNGELRNVTMDTVDYVKNNRGLVTKQILAQAISEHYEDQIRTSMDRSEVAEWIVSFTDFLMGHKDYRNEFLIKPYETKKHSYINNMYMFYGYIALSKKLQGNKEWKELLNQKIKSIDFSKENTMWREIGLINENNINKTTKKKLYSLFIEEVN
jgi:hypothetical protein